MRGDGTCERVSMLTQIVGAATRAGLVRQYSCGPAPGYSAFDPSMASSNRA
jgi:hypothetical protein